jgi:hypothetical protein
MSALVPSSIHFIHQSSQSPFTPLREEALQDVPDVEIESNWDQVVDK